MLNYKKFKDDIYRERGRVTQLMNQQAAIINDKNQLIGSADLNVFTYKGFNNVIYTVNTQAKTCDCFKFTDKAMCKHLAAACLKNVIFLNGLKQKPLKLRCIRKRLAKKDSACSSVSNTIINQAHIDNIIAESNIISIETISDPNIDVEPKSRKHKLKQIDINVEDARKLKVKEHVNESCKKRSPSIGK